MTSFRYRALDSSGRRVAGAIEADGPRSARQKLRDEGLVTVALDGCATATGSVPVRLPGLGGAPVFRRAELAVAMTQLSTLLSAGLPLAEALRTLAGMVKDRRQAALVRALVDRIADGGTLAAALAEHPRSFPAFAVASVDAGERSGGLPEVLSRLARHLDRTAALRRELVAALFYPALIGLVAAVVVLVLFTMVVPQLAEVFADRQADLPALTRTVLALSIVLTDHGAIILAGAIAAGAALAAGARTRIGGLVLDRLILALPAVGGVYRRFQLAGVLRTIAIVMGCGQPVLPAIRLALPVVRSPALRRACAGAIDAVSRGDSLRTALEGTAVFPPVVLGLVATGEAAGALPALLDRAASLEETDLQARLTALVKLVEPMLILIVGAIVLTVVLSVLVPILDLNRLLNV